MSIPKCFKKFRSTECDLQSCDVIQDCEDFTLCLADRIRLTSENAELKKKFKDFQQGICDLTGCKVSKSRPWATQLGDMNEIKITEFIK